MMKKFVKNVVPLSVLRYCKNLRTALKNDVKDDTSALDRKIYCCEVARRCNYSVWEVEKLSLPFQHYYPTERNWWNEMCGNASIIKKYVGLPNDYSLPLGILHGVLLKVPERFDNILEYLVEFSGEPIALTWGPILDDILLKAGVTAHSVGAPFFYAQQSMSDRDIQAERQRLGKTLILFPIHSGAESKALFDYDQFIADALRVKKEYQFDSIVTCLHWRDIGTASRYIQYGFECVTCGHSLDISFLERLKSILLLGDAIASNYIGSFVGYGINMDLPFFYFGQDVKFSDTMTTDFSWDINAFSEVVGMCLADFFTNDMCITLKQHEACQLIWGTDRICSCSDMQKIIFDAARY